MFSSGPRAGKQLGVENPARVYREFNGNSAWIVRLRGRTTPGLKIIPELGVGFPFSHRAVTVKLLKTEHEECTHCQKLRGGGCSEKTEAQPGCDKAEGESQGADPSICAR